MQPPHEERFRKKERKLEDINVNTHKEKDSMIELSRARGVLERIYLAFRDFPQTRKLSHADLAAFISAERESVSRNLWWCREILLMMYATDLEISKGING